MAWIHVPDWAKGEGRMRELYERFRRPDGIMDGILAIHGLHPAGLETHYALYREIMYGGSSPLSRREREMAAVAVSATNGCHY